MPGVHVESLGQGRDLVMLHGWAMHSGLFTDIAQRLAAHFRVHLVDLPGHGKSRAVPQPYELEPLARHVDEAVSPLLSGPAIWLGWSLGGTVASWITANRQDSSDALILVASNARFISQPDWPDGIEDSVLQEFAASLMSEYEKTLLRFLSLQLRGADNERELLRQLRQQMQQGQPPLAEALNGGLQILRDYDGRDLLSQIQQPLFIIGGGKDTLVPAEALRKMAALSADARMSVWPASGHAPFLSDPDRFVREVESFSHEVVE